MKPFFIKSASGNIFALYHPPEKTGKIKRNILFIAPFAEELNRSRHMINRQARKFCGEGYGVLILDLYGTGDSEGTFGEASVEVWQKDILAAIGWLNEKSATPPILWAMRSGALIAADIVQKYPDITDQMIFWSPVGNGEKFINQYLRIKLASEIAGNKTESKLTVKKLWERLNAGDNLEIAGYTLSPELARGFAGISLNKIRLPEKISLKWIEISPNDPPGLSPASQRIIEIWERDKINISFKTVNDIAFWTLQEPEWADSYIDRTMELVI